MQAYVRGFYVSMQLDLRNLSYYDKIYSLDLFSNLCIALVVQIIAQISWLTKALWQTNNWNQVKLTKRSSNA